MPLRWHSPQYWPNGRVDDDAASKIRELIAGRPTVDIYAEGLAEAYDAPQLRRKGYLISIDEWDVALSDICGVWWDTADEADILAKARSLGWAP